MTQHIQHSIKKKRGERPLSALNAVYLKNLLACPSKSVHLTTTSGRATQKRFLKDIFAVTSVLVNQMCSRTRKIGVPCKNGFFLLTWSRVADLCDLPEWRVKQCAKYLRDKGWLTSHQPWTARIGQDGKAKMVALTSIKRLTLKYFQDMGLTHALENAKKAGAKTIKDRAAKLNRPVKYILTPITLLREKKQHRPSKPPSNPPDDFHKTIAEFDQFISQFDR